MWRSSRLIVALAPLCALSSAGPVGDAVAADGTVSLLSRQSAVIAEANAMASGGGTCEEPHTPSIDQKSDSSSGPGPYVKAFSVSDQESVSTCGGASASANGSVSADHDVETEDGGLTISAAMAGSVHVDKDAPPVEDAFNFVVSEARMNLSAELRLSFLVNDGPVTLICDASGSGDDQNGPFDPVGSDVEVVVDGQEYGFGHRELVLDPGNHEINLSGFGYGAAADAGGGHFQGDASVSLQSQCSIGPQVAVAITSGPSGAVASKSAKFEFVALDTSPPPGRFECRLDSATFTPCTSPLSLSGLAEGQRRFEVRYHPDGDAAGAAASRSWTVDTIAPVAAFDAAPAGDGNPVEATIEFHADEPATFLCSLDGADPSGCASPTRLVGLSDGPHSFTVLPRDQAGNEGDTIAASWSVSGMSIGSPAAAATTVPPVAVCAPPRTTSMAHVGPFVLVAREDPSACFTERTIGGHRTYVSAGPVTWNGLLIRPEGGATITLHQEAVEAVVATTGPAKIDLGAAGTWRLPSKLTFGSAIAATATQTFALFDELQKDVDAAAFDVAGLPLTVSPTLKMTEQGGGKTEIGLKLGLPTRVLATHDFFGLGKPDETKGLSAEFTATASNENGFSFTGKASVDEAWLLGLLKLEDVSFGFDSEGPSFEGGAAISFGPPVKAGKSKKLGLALAVGPGGFLGKLRKASINTSNINAPIGATPFFFQEIGATGEGDDGGVKFSGTVGVSGGPTLPLVGEALGLKGTVTLELPKTGPWSVEGKGEAEIVEVPVAETSLKYINGKQVELKGKLDLSIAGTGLLAEIRDAWFTKTDFNVGASGTVSLFGNAGTAEAVVSKSGYAVCIGEGESRIGFGKRWGQSADVFGDLCDLGPFSSAAASAAQASDAGTIVVPPNRSLFAVQASGAGGAPMVAMSGPGGFSISSPLSSDPVRTKSATLYQDPARSTTTIIMRKPVAGTYRLVPLVGVPTSPGPFRVSTAENRPPIRIHARVSGKGAKRTLGWSLRTIPGQRVTFVERGPVAAQVITTTSKAQGRVRFTPNPTAGAARRTIEARVVQSDLPRDTFPVARFRFSTKLRRVRGVKRVGARLRWLGQRGATSYTIVLESANGSVTTQTTAKPRLTIPRALRRGRLRVTIYPLDGFQRSGPALAVKLKRGR